MIQIYCDMCKEYADLNLAVKSNHNPTVVIIKCLNCKDFIQIRESES